jgi:hypothetical protein
MVVKVSLHLNVKDDEREKSEALNYGNGGEQHQKYSPNGRATNSKN